MLKDINIKALSRRDPSTEALLISASQVAMYQYNATTSQWERGDTEGSMHVYRRSANPRFSFLIMNRNNPTDLVEPITADMELSSQNPYLFYKKKSRESEIQGIWFYDPQACQKVTELMQRLINEQQKQTATLKEQEEAQQQSTNSGKNILGMLAKATNNPNLQNQHQLNSPGGGIARPQPMYPGSSPAGSRQQQNRTPKTHLVYDAATDTTPIRQASQQMQAPQISAVAAASENVMNLFAAAASAGNLPPSPVQPPQSSRLIQPSAMAGNGHHLSGGVSTSLFRDVPETKPTTTTTLMSMIEPGFGALTVGNTTTATTTNITSSNNHNSNGKNTTGVIGVGGNTLSTAQVGGGGGNMPVQLQRILSFPGSSASLGNASMVPQCGSPTAPDTPTALGDFSSVSMPTSDPQNNSTTMESIFESTAAIGDGGLVMGMAPETAKYSTPIKPPDDGVSKLLKRRKVRGGAHNVRGNIAHVHDDGEEDDDDESSDDEDEDENEL